MSNYYNNKKGGYKNSSLKKASISLLGNKKIIGIISISLVLLLVVGGLGFLSGGFLNWNLMRWLEKPAAAAEITNTLPLSVTYADLTRGEFSSPEAEEVFYIYYLEIDGEFDFEDVPLVEICISSVTERYSNVFYSIVRTGGNNIYTDEEDTEYVLYTITQDSPIKDLSVLLLNGYTFSEDDEYFYAPEAGKTIMIVCYQPDDGNDELEIPSDLTITMTATELIALDTPVIEVNSELGIIEWSEVDYAASYKVYVDDEDPVTVTSESYNYAAAISAPGEHTISVQAVPGTSSASLIYDVSEISEAVTVTTGDLAITSDTLTLSKDGIEMVFTSSSSLPDPSYEGKILMFLGTAEGNTMIIFLEDFTDDAVFGTVEAGTIVIPFFSPVDEEIGFEITPEAFLDAPHVTTDFASEPETIDIDITGFDTETTNNGTWTLSGLTYDYE